MKGSVSKAIAATAAASMACEVPLPAVADEVVVANPGGLGDDLLAEALEAVAGHELAAEPGDLPQAFMNEGYLPETQDPDAPQAARRPDREYPR